VDSGCEACGNHLGTEQFFSGFIPKSCTILKRILTGHSHQFSLPPILFAAAAAAAPLLEVPQLLRRKKKRRRKKKPKHLREAVVSSEMTMVAVIIKEKKSVNNNLLFIEGNELTKALERKATRFFHFCTPVPYRTL